MQISINKEKERIAAWDKKEQKRKEKRKKLDEEIRIDSLKMEVFLKTLLIDVKKNINAENFSKTYEAVLDSNSLPVKTEIEIGHFFSKTDRHLLIRRHGANDVYLNVFLIRKNDFEPVLFHKEWNMTYVKDTIRDVNDDGYKDFLVNWYGSSGCCLKNFYNVYLYQPNKRKFAKDLEFINPTFYPKERIIRGIRYGHPGETELYKYKWKGDMVDTIEYVYPNKNPKIKAKYIITKNLSRKSDSKKKEISRLPPEYETVEELDWFLGKGIYKTQSGL